MLDRTDFASWQQHGNISGETLAEGNEGALHLGPERPRVYSDLSPKDKEMYNADIRETNILLQGLPKDIYSLINHYTDAKDIWYKSQRETNHDYNVRSCETSINDIRNIKMTMSIMQLNSKFVNNMLPEWGRFVTVVKLNRGLRDSNYDQLYAYLKQHEAYANENKMLFDRFTQHTVDTLALISNVAPQQYNSQSSRNLSSTYVPPHFADNSQLDSGLSPTDNLIENLTNTLALLAQSYKTYLPQINKPLRTSSQPRNQPETRWRVEIMMFRVDRIEDMVTLHGVQVKCYNYNDIGHITRNCTQPKRPQNSEYFKDKTLLMQAQENGVALDEEQLLFLAGGQDNAVDEDVDEQPVQDLALNVDNVFQADDGDAFDSDVYEAPTAQTMFMAKLSFADLVYDKAGPSYDSDILSESDQYVKYNEVPVVQSNVSFVPNDAYMMIYNDMYEPHAQSVSKTTWNTVVDNSLTAELATCKEQVELYKRWARAENEKIKQHYKELYDSIKITHAKHLEPTIALLTENESLKVQIHNKLSCVNKDHVKPKVLAPGKYAIDVEPIPPRNRNNREVHLVYLKHLKESVETLYEIVKEVKVERPLDSSLASACLYTKHSQELLEYVIETCPKDLNIRDNKHASTPLPKKK
ncbi:hypothetical protein Tco_0117903 [Tanacetum coccineum]